MPPATMADMMEAAIGAIICMVTAVTLAPLSKTLRDQGAADWFALIFLVIAGIALLGMFYWIFRLVRLSKR